MKIQKAYLRSKGDLNYGWGHIMRSYRLAQFLAENEPTVQILMAVEGNEAVQDFLKIVPLKTQLLQSDKFLKQEDELLSSFKPELIIVDKLHFSTQELAFYKRHCEQLVVFNDLGFFYEIGDIVIMPQILDSYPVLPGAQRILAGPEYFIIDPSFLKVRQNNRRISEMAQTLLVVTGGCVKKSVFDQIIAVVGHLGQHDFKINIVLGFDHDIDLAPHRHLEANGIRFISGTDRLADLMAEADFALASSGYVKYELAAAGTPALLVAIVDHQESLGQVFAAKSRAATYLGDFIVLDPKSIAEAIIDCARSFRIRESMSIAGMRLIDGKALSRIHEEIFQQ